MSDASRHARRPRPLTGHEAMVMKFMRDRGHTAYDNDLQVLTDQFDETVAEAGPGGNHCEITQQRLDAIQREMDETIQMAVDRYDDWASDPLP